MMHRSTILVCAALSGLIAASLPSPAAEAVKSEPEVLMTTPLAGDDEREVKIVNVILPPGADSGRHFHHGDQYTTVQDGEIHITVDGSGEHVLKAGEALHIDPMVVHRTQNMTDKPARTTEVFIVAKGKPITEKSE